MTRKKPEIINLDQAALNELVRRAENQSLRDEDYEIIAHVIKSYAWLTGLVDNKNTTIGRLRKLLFGDRTEKTADVLGRLGGVSPADRRHEASGEEAAAPASAASPGEANRRQPVDAGDAADPPRAARPGHGRHGADDFPGAKHVDVPHESLAAGDLCPACERGSVYAVARPGVLIRFVGQAPLEATVYRLQKLRCGTCGELFTAAPPAGVGEQKYDATVASMIALLKYGGGLPFNRCQGLQRHLQIPLPASTQWEIVSAPARKLQPVFEEFVREAAQGDIVFNDDTNVKILERMGKRRQAALAEAAEAERDDAAEQDDGRPPPKRERKGLYTTGVVSTTHEGRKIALYFSGDRHAGENLQQVLRRREAGREPPIQMCDALSRNVPAELKTILANCLAHGRRQFVDVHDRFTAECGYVLEALAAVYRNDALARERELSPQERLAFHQAESAPVMEDLRLSLKRQFDERLVEPNSPLGAAINYLRNHWRKLTLFLHKAGAPLDNNICERALKKAILHRKNSLFYKTQNGANVGDMYMSLIHTCELCDANPFDYLTQLVRHAEAAAAEPHAWLPWTYRATLAPAA